MQWGQLSQDNTNPHGIDQRATQEVYAQGRRHRDSYVEGPQSRNHMNPDGKVLTIDRMRITMIPFTIIYYGHDDPIHADGHSPRPHRRPRRRPPEGPQVGIGSLGYAHKGVVQRLFNLPLGEGLPRALPAGPQSAHRRMGGGLLSPRWRPARQAGYWRWVTVCRPYYCIHYGGLRGRAGRVRGPACNLPDWLAHRLVGQKLL